jgi:AraC family transcriptional activator of pobA
MNESFELKNPAAMTPSFRVCSFNTDSNFEQLTTFNYFTIILIVKGRGELTVDASEYTFEGGHLMSFSLYQPFRINVPECCEGYLVAFHPDFFCLHQHREEVSCNGILFNNIYEPPLINLSETEISELSPVITGMLTECKRGEPETEVLLSYLKILLINGSRIKVDRRETIPHKKNQIPEKLIAVRSAIEANFRLMHSASAYADLLNSTLNSLNRTCRAYFNKTLSTLITDRVVLEAKRELYLTSKPVKAIAYDLGFPDEFHFSRYFKRNIGVSPQYFRDTVGFGKASAE